MQVELNLENVFAGKSDGTVQTIVIAGKCLLEAEKNSFEENLEIFAVISGTAKKDHF